MTKGSHPEPEANSNPPFSRCSFTKEKRRETWGSAALD
jgi:hypothetical protein